MQLIQKHLPRKNWLSKPISYFILAALLLSCKPFLYGQGIGFVFDYKVAINRIQNAADWLAFQLASDNKSTVVYGGDKK